MRAADPVRPVIIAIDGRSGAGKTTLALELVALLREHRRVSLFHLENIYPGWNGLSAGVERYVSTVLGPLADGMDARWSSWDWENHYDGDSRTTPLADVIVVEGVGAAHATARPFLDTVIWVEAAPEQRKKRALDRDGDTYAPFWDEWAAQEDLLFADDDAAATADLVLEGAGAGDRGHTPARVLAALSELPALEQLLAPERARRRGLELSVERMVGMPDPEQLFAALYGESVNAVWLDSSNAASLRGGVLASANLPAGQSRFSIMADDSGHFGQSAQHTDGVTTLRAGALTTRIRGPFFRWLDTAWGRRAVRAPESFPAEFTLGWLGYLGYELKSETGGRPAATAASVAATVPASVPKAQLLFAGRAVVVDHEQQCVFLLTLTEASQPDSVAEARQWLERAGQLCAQASGAAEPPVGPFGPLAFTVRDSEADYKAKIAAAQTQIWDGNSYEICLTTELSAHTVGRLDAWECYRALRRRSPAPFAAFLRFGPLAVCSSSPERFLRVDAAGLMRAEPIKGTRRRHPDPVHDEALRTDLATSLKDRAENIMIVDLLRNDLSHFAVPSSLRVPRLCEIESYATVHQLVSTIEAQLRPGSSRAQAVAAAFPAGSMTGAPKISTMAILDELEGAPRGVYSGAIGYFSLNSAMDLSVTIRTLVLEETDDGGTHLSLGVGGAITADSSPHEEWLEIQAKAFGVLSTLGSDFPSTD